MRDTTEKIVFAAAWLWLLAIGVWLNLFAVTQWLRGPFGQPHHHWLLFVAAHAAAVAAGRRARPQFIAIVFLTLALVSLVPHLYLIAYLPSPALMAWVYFRRARHQRR